MRNTFKYGLLLSMSITTLNAQQEIPLTARVNVQSDSARLDQIIDHQWVGVGTGKEHAIVLDGTIPFKGKPSYRFELKEDDNTLEGYAQGETKGRAELSYCYATSADFAKLSSTVYETAQKKKTVYHYGKGQCAQGSRKKYTFSVYIPSQLSPTVSTIFAQWHGMPDRTLVSNPEGKVMTLTDEEFLNLEAKTIFKKDTGYDKVIVKDKEGNPRKDKKGNLVYKTGKKNGWIIEQGGYPPLAFGFSDGFFYIKANSDRKWLSDKTDRCNINTARAEIMKPQCSTYKCSTIAYKMAFDEFPKDTWVTFDIDILWTLYGKEKETILKAGNLDVQMDYKEGNKAIQKHIVDKQPIQIGRNDEDGYYFKFGIYRVGNSTVPVRYNLANYSEK